MSSLWSILFIATLAQSIFQVSLLIYGRRLNNLPAKILVALMAFLTILNLEYLIFSSGFYKTFPHLLGFSSGFIFLVGPSLYFYTQSVLHENFRLKKIHLLHLVLFALYYVLAIQVFTMKADDKIAVIDYFLNGQTAITSFDYFLFVLQLGHIVAYLIANEISLRKYATLHTNLKTHDKERFDWLKFSRLMFAGYAFMIFSIYIYIISVGSYTANSSFTYAFSYTVIVYVLSATLYVKPQVILGERFKKYKSSNLSETDIEIHLAKLKSLMETEKIFTEPELKLNELADYLKISAHNLSQIINDSFNQSFIDYVNSYRVKEFQNRIQQPDSSKFTLLSLAHEVGFNSKSAFNAAFKKHTGQTPTEFKKLISSSAHS